MRAGGREEERLAQEAVAKIRDWAEKRKRAPGADSLPHLAIKFCGGCNPVVDRGQLARNIREHLGGLVRWVPVEEKTDLLLVICGCLAACADRTGVTEMAAEYFVLAGPTIVLIQKGMAKNSAESL